MEQKKSQNEIKQEKDAFYREREAILCTWAGNISKINRLERELKQAREDKSRMEKTYPFLGKIKGDLYKEEKKKKIEDQVEMEEELPSQVEEEVENKKRKIPLPKKKRDLIKKMEELEDKNKPKKPDLVRSSRELGRNQPAPEDFFLNK